MRVARRQANPGQARRRCRAAVTREAAHLQAEVACVYRGEEECDHDDRVHERQASALQQAKLAALGCSRAGFDERTGDHSAEHPEGVNGRRSVGLLHCTRRARDTRVHRTRARRCACTHALEGLALHGERQRARGAGVGVNARREPLAIGMQESGKG